YDTLPARADVRVEQIDRDVRAAIGGRRDAPEDQDAEQKLAEVVAVGDRDAEEVTQHDRDEDVGRDHADADRSNPLDRVDEPIHQVGFPGPSALTTVAAVGSPASDRSDRAGVLSKPSCTSRAPP